MKQRVLHTRIWNDTYFSELAPVEKLLFIYIITNDRVNIIRCYELPERKALWETGATPKQWRDAKIKFQKDRKFAFYKDWIFLLNASRYEKYTGARLEVAIKEERNQLPPDVKEWYTRIDTGMDTPIEPIEIEGGLRQEPEENNTGIHRGIDRGIDTPYISISTSNSLSKGGVGEKFLEAWNKAMGTKYTSFKAFEKNLDYWLTMYTDEEILTAIATVPRHHWWKDKMTPEMFLRKKNPTGENVDRIGEMLNYKPSKAFEGENKDKYKDL